MKVDRVCKTIYSTSGDKELLDGMLEPGGMVVLKKTHMTDHWAHFNIGTPHFEACYCLMPFLWGRFNR